MKIALDAMGGDEAPAGIVEGAYEAAREARERLEILLVGKRDLLQEYMASRGLCAANVRLVEAEEIIGMSETPSAAIRRKRNASIPVAMNLHRTGEVQAVVGAGNTGAMVASSLLQLGRLPGIERPAIAIYVPTGRRGGTVLLDGGANSDCEPVNLLQFAFMGSVYAESQLGKKEPKIGLLSIGEERSKGNELSRASYELLEKSGLNFVGNVEGRDIFAGKVDVVVTDGFVGNIVLKFTESIVYYMSSLIADEVQRHILAKIGALLMKPVFGGVKRKLDYAEYGGAPLLGVNGVVLICHGKSSPRAIKNAILAAERFVECGINEKIRQKADRS